MKLTSENVEKLFDDCLFGKNSILIEGIVSKANLDVNGHEEEIKELLLQLPEPFLASKGGGWSFLQACQDKDNNQWTGFHMVMEKLVLLGIAANKAKFLFSRDMWEVMPGGVPYFVVLDKEETT